MENCSGQFDNVQGSITLAALSQTSGILIYSIQPEVVATGGAHSRIYACKSEIGDLILRISKGQQGFYTHYFPDRTDPDAWMNQKWAIEKARSVGVPAPEIICSDRKHRWTLMKRLPGIAIDGEYESWKQCPYDEQQFGILLSRLHSIQPSGFGPIDDYGKAIFPTWQDFLIYAAESALNTCIERGALSLDLAETLEKHWFPHLNTIAVEKPHLLHMESLGFANILYDPETRTITGLLDYEDCIGGDPLFEICWMKYYIEHDSQNQQYFDFARFYEGYGSIALDIESLELYTPFPILDKLRWIEQESSRAKGYIRWLEDFVRQY